MEQKYPGFTSEYIDNLIKNNEPEIYFNMGEKQKIIKEELKDLPLENKDITISEILDIITILCDYPLDNIEARACSLSSLNRSNYFLFQKSNIKECKIRNYFCVCVKNKEELENYHEYIESRIEILKNKELLSDKEYRAFAHIKWSFDKKI